MGRRERPRLFVPFLIGMIAGWFLRGLNKVQSFQPNSDKNAAKLIAAEAKVSQLVTQMAEVETLKEKLVASEEEIARLQTLLAEETLTADDLTKINGIGKVFAKRLNEAGVTTFAQLANLSIDEVMSITQAKELQNPQDWLTQAKELAH